jgi:hypothetical protein
LKGLIYRGVFMKIWKLSIPILAAVLFAASMNGCYTMLIHPPVATVDDSTNEETTAEVDHSERCTDCHTGNVHGSVSDSGMNRGRTGGFNNYDPYWNNDYNGYYDPWFMGSSMYSPFFYDNYYQYNTVPWWLYNGVQSSGGSENQAVPREKPVRRGGSASEGRRDTSSPSVGSTSRQTGAEKETSPAPKQEGSSSGDTEPEKEKPVRRGGIK